MEPEREPLEPEPEPIELRDRPPHTAAKHQLLSTYLGAWFPIIAKYNQHMVYYDAFSGPGQYKGNVDGSPMIALKTLIDHDAFAAMSRTEFFFLFNEQDTVCAEYLAGLVSQFQETRKPWPKNVKVGITNTTFIELTTEMLDDLDSRNARLGPTFAFVDPVGVKATPMSVLKRLTDYPKGELLVYFAHEAVFRFCGAGNIDEALTDLFGTDEYKDARFCPGGSAASTFTTCIKGSCTTSAASLTSRASQCMIIAENDSTTCSTVPANRSVWIA